MPTPTPVTRPRRSASLALLAFAPGGLNIKCGPTPDEAVSALLVATPVAYLFAVLVAAAWIRAWRFRWPDARVDGSRVAWRVGGFVLIALLGLSAFDGDTIGVALVVLPAFTAGATLLIARVFIADHGPGILTGAPTVILGIVVVISVFVLMMPTAASKDALAGPMVAVLVMGTPGAGVAVLALLLDWAVARGRHRSSVADVDD